MDVDERDHDEGDEVEPEEVQKVLVGRQFSEVQKQRHFQMHVVELAKQEIGRTRLLGFVCRRDHHGSVTAIRQSLIRWSRV